MFQKILTFLREMFISEKSYHRSLDAYISANNPQTPDDVDRLIKEHQRLNSVTLFEKYY